MAEAETDIGTDTGTNPDGPPGGNDGPDRRERLLNLLAALLESRRGMTRDEILENPTLGYSSSTTAARRAFERDKATLRAMGVPLEDAGEGADLRYRVDPARYYLPDLGLTDDELAALHVAVTAVGLGSAAGEGALMKLGGLAGEGAMPVAELPFVAVVTPLFEASRNRQLVTFEYRGRSRTLQPWGLTSKFGRWYVVGFDADADDMRVFRADRIDGDIAAEGEPGAFSVPEDFRADAYLEDRPWDYGDGRATEIEIHVDPGYEFAFCQAVGPDAIARPQADGSTLVTVRAVESGAVVNFVLGFLEHVEIVGPPEVRAAMIEHLDRWDTP